MDVTDATDRTSICDDETFTSRTFPQSGSKRSKQKYIWHYIEYCFRKGINSACLFV